MTRILQGILLLGTLLPAGGCYADYAVDSRTVALWKFNRWQGLTIPEDGPDSLHLMSKGTFVGIAGQAQQAPEPGLGQ